MCGFAGFLTPAGLDRSAEATLRRMTDQIRHRGPDDSGAWCDDVGGIALGHRRLSILDLSPLGHQPMESPSGRFMVIYNGEIYNFASIRRDLESNGHGFRGHSDTEVLLSAFERWGVVPTLEKAVGMFALALWDREVNELHLIRDRLGEKPLYYGWFGESLLFGSELKAIRAHPAWRGELDRGALALYLRHNYVPAPHTIYRGLFKALPGTVLTFSIDQPGAPPRQTVYWSARTVAERGLASPLDGSPSEIIEQCDAVLRRAIGEQMVADVPLGAFLSGGIDSSLVVSLMQQQSRERVRTFTIGFNEAEYNEAEHAKAVAAHLGTLHTEMYVTPSDTLGVIPKLPTMYDEPFSDASQIPTFLVAQLARRHVTVSLSGDGGDELFGGYNRYAWGERIWDKVRALPPALRRSVATALTSVAPERWDRLIGTATRALPPRYRLKMAGDRVHKLAGILSAESREMLYRRLTSTWQDPAHVVLGAIEPPTALTDPARALGSTSFIEQMMYLDTVSYLPDDILVKVDRASMAVSLESRAPFLDHRVVEFAWQVPLSLKVRDGQGKWLLRQVLDRYVPRALIERPKMGFGVPIDVWLRGPLREWAAALLDPQRIRREGYFDAAAIDQKWREHQSGSRNWQYLLWAVLVFQAWLETQSPMLTAAESESAA
jgi:asparagine synthase (glutamine-hydrolysing)